MSPLLDTQALIERLRGYNPPDRTVPEQRQIAQDIVEAAAELTRLRERVAELEAALAKVRAENSGLVQTVRDAAGHLRRAAAIRALK